MKIHVRGVEFKEQGGEGRSNGSSELRFGEEFIPFL